MLLQGRSQIYSEYKKDDMYDFKKIADIVNGAMTTHVGNQIEIDFLIGYYKGNQPILEKTKSVRPEINNIMLVNHAQRITRTVVGYFLGNPIQLVNKKGDKKDQVEYLNEILDYEDKGAVDKEIGDYQSITGTAYRIIYSDTDDIVPFEERALNPSDTFVVYENTISEKPLMGVTFRDVYDETGNVIAYDFYIYTEIGSYYVRSNSDFEIEYDADFSFSQYSIGGVPIIEYPNNKFRMGDWEMAISIMNMVNNLYSGRMDDVEQLVQALLVFVNAEIDSEAYAEMRESGLVMLKNTTNLKSDIKTITNQLDQNGMNLLSKEIEGVLDTIVGVPSRNERSGGGGDTGQAVELRDGWADLEIVTRNKELTFKRSEKKSLRIILNILRNKQMLDLTPFDIDIKFVRNKNNNLLVKAQSYSTLISTKTLDPSDCLAVVDLASNVKDLVDRGEEYWGGTPADLENSSAETSENSENSEDEENSDNLE